MPLYKGKRCRDLRHEEKLLLKRENHEAEKKVVDRIEMSCSRSETRKLYERIKTQTRGWKTGKLLGKTKMETWL